VKQQAQQAQQQLELCRVWAAAGVAAAVCAVDGVWPAALQASHMAVCCEAGKLRELCGYCSGASLACKQQPQLPWQQQQLV
jgi:hypothetical protein